MSKIKVVGLLMVAGLVAIITLIACGSSPTQIPLAMVPTVPPTLTPTPAPTPDGATLLETRCSVCHSPDRARTYGP
jgi:cytochrome c5